MTPVADSLRPRLRARRVRAGLHATLTFVDPLRLAGVALFVAVWQTATLALPPVILPTPMPTSRLKYASTFQDSRQVSMDSRDPAADALSCRVTAV